MAIKTTLICRTALFVKCPVRMPVSLQLIPTDMQWFATVTTSRSMTCGLHVDLEQSFSRGANRIMSVVLTYNTQSMGLGDTRLESWLIPQRLLVVMMLGLKVYVGWINKVSFYEHVHDFYCKCLLVPLPKSMHTDLLLVSSIVDNNPYSPLCNFFL